MANYLSSLTFLFLSSYFPLHIPRDFYENPWRNEQHPKGIVKTIGSAVVLFRPLHYLCTFINKKILLFINEDI